MPTEYGSNSSSYSTGPTVAAFTPPANKVLFCVANGANSGAPTGITGHGTWTLLEDFTNSSNRRMVLYGILIGGSPSSDTVRVAYATNTRRAITVFSFDDIDHSSLAASWAQIETGQATGVPPKTVGTTLANFGDATNNVAIVIADSLSGSGDATTTAKSGYSALSTVAYLDIYYKTGEDTSPNYTTNAAYISNSIIALELVAASGGGGQTVTATGIATAEAFGSHTLTTGAVSVSPGGIASLESFGSLAFTSLVEIFPGSIASLETFGSPTFSTTFEIIAQAINSAEAFGSAIVAPGEVVLLPSGIPTAEAFGAAVASRGALILPLSIETLEAFGNPALTAGVVTILPSSIGSGEAFGIATIGDVVVVGREGMVRAMVTNLTKDMVIETIG